MTRNPALLADMWDDQALLGAHLLLVDSCFHPTGAYGWGADSAPPDVSKFGNDRPVLLQARMGDTYPDGTPLPLYQDEPFREVCYGGPAPFLPQVGVTMKLAPDLGVGLGFFPPDGAGLTQWGNRDGTIDTPDGKRPNPTRFFRSNQTVSFFTLLGAVGYRLNDFIRVGLGLQWNLAVFEATTWTTPQLPRNTMNDVKTEVFGRDLFIPGVIASVHIKPFEALDIAAGFKWSDRIKSKAKLDVVTGAFGLGEPFEFVRNGQTIREGSSVPYTNANLGGVVETPGIWMPQLMFGIRFSDRLKPAFKDWQKGKLASGKRVEDSMANERWDIEADFIYYFTSEYDRSQFTTPESSAIILRSVSRDGVVSDVNSSVGKCTDLVVDVAAGEDNCPSGVNIVKTDFGGKDQYSFRLGGDYNVLPGLFTVRAGVSHETDGQDPSMLNILNYMLSRTGIHAGLTLRVADKTDISLGFAHFIQRDIRLQVGNRPDDDPYPRKYKDPKYNFYPGEGVAPLDAMNPGKEGDFDGVAGVEVPNGSKARPLSKPGPHYINAGSYFYNLDVVSLSFSQHF